MRAEKELLMQYLSNYSLECFVATYKKRGYFLNNLSMIFKIFAVLSLIALFFSWYFLILTFSLWVCGIIINYYKNSLFFTYKYSIFEDNLEITKEDLRNKKEVLVNINLTDIICCNIITEIPENIKAYFCQNTENGFLVNVTTEKDDFVMLSDEYMYSLLCRKESRGEKINDIS